MSGYKLVPVEPTAEMVKAFKAMWSLGFCDGRMAQECYAAIMNAAPAVQGEPVAWVTADTIDGQAVNGKPRRIWWENNEGVGMPIYTTPQTAPSAPTPTFQLGDHVRKTKGSQWRGRVVGTYSTTLTPEGYAVESDTETGSVQIYPVGALELVGEDAESDVARMVEALDITELRKLLLILRGNIGGAMWTLDDEEEELAVRTEKAIDAIAALAAHRKQEST